MTEPHWGAMTARRYGAGGDVQVGTQGWQGGAQVGTQGGVVPIPGLARPRTRLNLAQHQYPGQPGQYTSLVPVWPSTVHSGCMAQYPSLAS